MPDKPGSLYQILKLLAQEEINVDYMYAFSNRDIALGVIRSAEIGKVMEILQQNGIKLLSQSDIYQMRK